jgi:hypothetical protein
LYSLIYELAAKGNAVLLGRGGNMLFQSLPCTLHVRIIASQGKRVETHLARGLTRGTALREIEKNDYERGGFIKFAFHRDWANPELYDIVLNTDNLSVGGAVNAILSVARSEEVLNRSVDMPTSLEALRLAAKVAAALAERGLPSSYVSAAVDAPGKVRLTGVVQVPWDKSAAEDATRGVKGVESVENRIEVAGSSPDAEGRS